MLTGNCPGFAFMGFARRQAEYSKGNKSRLINVGDVIWGFAD